MVCQKQSFQYDASLFQAHRWSNIYKLKEFISSHTISTLATIAVSTTLVMAISTVLFLQQNSSNNNDMNSSTGKDVEMFKKNQQNAFVDEIEYSTFPTKDNLEVAIKLKKNISKKDIKILLDDNELPFEKEKEEIRLYANENGKYKISIKGVESSFIVENIDQYAPSVVGVYQRRNHIELVVDDVMSEIDYGKSYVEYEGRKVELTKELIIKGEFEGEIKVKIFNKAGYHITYSFQV